MDRIKNDAYYCRKLTDDLKFIMIHTAGVSREEFQNNAVLQDCVMFRLIQISENSQKLNEEFKKLYSEIPWTAIKGMRNRIVHEYGDVDITIIYDTVVKDVPALYTMLLPLI